MPGLVSSWLQGKKMPTRTFGKTGWKASIYALGSAELPDGEDGVEAIKVLIEAGVNYLDTAPSYRGTQSETTIGKAVAGKPRDSYYVATKTLERTADGAYREVTESLKRLNCEYINTLQIHAVNDDATLDAVLKKGGAITGLEKAKNDGLIRHIGITGHTSPEVISRALDEYPFESILVPVSAVDKHISDFADEVLPKANELGIGIAGMKSLKGVERATGGKFEAPDLLRYSLSLPISTLTIGLRRAVEVEQNLKTVIGFKPMSPVEMANLEESVKQHANTDTLWWKKR